VRETTQKEKLPSLAWTSESTNDQDTSDPSLQSRQHQRPPEVYRESRHRLAVFASPGVRHSCCLSRNVPAVIRVLPGLSTGLLIAPTHAAASPFRAYKPGCSIISNQQTMSSALQLDCVGLSDPIISSGSSALSPITQSPLRARPEIPTAIPRKPESQCHDAAGTTIYEDPISNGEREPLLNGLTSVRPAKKPFYRPRPLWYVCLSHRPIRQYNAMSQGILDMFKL
jgi:hypothetical protein